jgi:hypothetical protein
MNVFISHNSRGKDSARLLAIALVEQGVNVWFDEWAIRPGDSITGGIETGLSEADVFVLVWSANAKKSNWVGTEVRAYLRRRVDDETLRIVPVMLDTTPLPTLVADYRGFSLDSGKTMDEIASEITGKPSDVEIARRLQEKLLDLMWDRSSGGDPLPYLVCPKCGSPELERSEQYDRRHEANYYVIQCQKCGWLDSTEV